MKADYNFYTRFCGGNVKIPSAEYERWENCAELELSRRTAGKSDGADGENIKMCICEIAEIMYAIAKTQGIKSENNDGYSVNYAGDTSHYEIDGAVKRYLHGTDLFYRGVDV